MEQQKQVRKITLGERKRGICLYDRWGQEWHFVFDDKFTVFCERPGVVMLRSGEKRLLLENIDGEIFIQIYGQPFLFKPFLKIHWLREMLRYHGE